MQEVGGSAPRLSWPLAGLGANPHDAVVAGGDEGGVFGRPYDPGDVSGVAGDECFLLPRPGVPDFQLLVGTPAGDRLAVRLEGEAAHGGGMGLDLLELATVCHVPKPDELILPGGGERLAIRREGDGKNRSFMRGPGQALGQVGGVPKGHFSRISRCVAGGDERPAVGAERERADTPGQAVELPCRCPVCGVPEYHFPVSTGGQMLAVRAPCDGLDDVAVAGELGQAGRFFFSHAVDDYLVAMAGSQALVVWRVQTQAGILPAGRPARRRWQPVF